MNWKQVIYTSIITLLITVLSGIIVNWYSNTQLEKDETSEKLVYYISDASQFKTDSMSLSLFSYNIENIGNKTANNVIIRVKLNKSLIKDTYSSISRTKEHIIPNVKNGFIEYLVPKLYPKDKIAIKIAANKTFNAFPQITLQSSESIGHCLTFTSSSDDENYWIILLLTTLLLIPGLYLFTKIYRRFKGYGHSLNNSAFLFLHSKQIVMAEDLLNKAIRTKGATAHELANLALTKGIKDRAFDDSYLLLKMAKFTSTNKNSDFVIEFNTFLISSLDKDYLKAQEHLRNAKKMNKNELIKYIEHSLIVEDLKKNDSKIADMLTNEFEQ